MLKILITGGAGFIGSNLSLELIDKGHKVTVLDNLSPQIHSTHPLENSPLYRSIHNKVHFIHGDVTNISDWERAIKDQEVIVHLAAETVRRRIGPLRQRKPQRKSAGLLGRVRRIESGSELPRPQHCRRMGTLRQPARQHFDSRRGKLAAAGKNPPRRIEKRTARTGRHHARLHLLAGQRKQRQKR